MSCEVGRDRRGGATRQCFESLGRGLSVAGAAEWQGWCGGGGGFRVASVSAIRAGLRGRGGIRYSP